MKSRKLGIGIIGTGQIARLAHIPGYQAVADQCEIVAAADVSAEARAAAQRVSAILPIMEIRGLARHTGAGQYVAAHAPMGTEAQSR